jgi:hypothetical protein
MASIAEKSLAVCQLFEGELLLELMLRYWQHPLADDREFRNEMIEAVTTVLQEAVAGSYFIEGMSPANMNFVAAVYYAELRGCEDAASAGDETKLRHKWLTAVRRSLPSCFCEPDLLGE